MEISDEIFEAANQRGKAKKAAYPTVVSVRYDRRISKIVVSLASGLDLAFSPHDAQGLENARAVDLVDIQVSASGLGIHFPKLDADIYIPALMEGFLGSKSWIAAENGSRGGKSASSVKSAAARQNGRLGGRPRKQPMAEATGISLDKATKIAVAQS